ncbi:MAG: hypothetical protein GY749_18535 [Desulfobacteraceae bacterium]|nr:hypothetical protein [Desulfobacteraceae bacterium]
MIIVQTTIIPSVPLLDKFYDLLIPFVLYIGIFRPAHEGIVVIISGYVMDCLSGGPVGLYGTTYLWLFAGSKWLRQFFHFNNKFVLPLFVTTGVLLENFIFIGAFVILNTVSPSPLHITATVVCQVSWAMVTGSSFLTALYYTHKRWDNWFSEIFERESSNG